MNERWHGRIPQALMPTELCDSAVGYTLECRFSEAICLLIAWEMG